MAYPGMELVNPLTGQRIVIRRTAAETGGALVEMDMFYQPGGEVDAEHIHPIQEERFEVIAGTMRFIVDGREQVAGPGATLTVLPRTRHTFINIGPDVAQVRVTYTPALQSEQFFEAYFGLAQDGKLNPQTHMPGLLQLAVMMRAFRNELRPTAISPWVDRLVLAPLSIIAGLLGYHGHYPYRQSVEGRPAIVEEGQR